ncbi:hypothetical protein PVT71_26750 (plasmid) [Salipiger sp. H15]|uniref:Uncharacterized protein n=1 Tax=Alloyangia sp. H15 TaxID=3029062 RepID=A0AAU8ATF5_9RHOB
MTGLASVSQATPSRDTIAPIQRISTSAGRSTRPPVTIPNAYCTAFDVSPIVQPICCRPAASLFATQAP